MKAMGTQLTSMLGSPCLAKNIWFKYEGQLGALGSWNPYHDWKMKLKQKPLISLHLQVHTPVTILKFIFSEYHFEKKVKQNKTAPASLFGLTCPTNK